MKEIALDPTDVEILKMLTFDSRTSYSTIASALEITVNTVKNRIRRILASKVIDNFLTIPNFAILGFDSSFSVLVRHNGISQEMVDRLAGLGQLYMRVDLLGNVSLFKFLLKGGSKPPTPQQLGALLQPNQVLRVISEEYHCDFAPLQTDWKLIYWLVMDPRIRVNELAKKASVTEKTVARRLEAMSKRRVLAFSLQYNPAAMSNYQLFRIVAMIDQSLRDSIMKQVHVVSEDHFMSIVPPSSDTMLSLMLFAKNASELEAVRTKMEAIKGIVGVIPNTPLKVQFNQRFLLEEIGEKAQIRDDRKILNVSSES